MERISFDSIENFKVHGRISNREVGGIPLFWSASCLEINVTGSELYIEYEHKSGYFESYIRIEVDGFDFMRFMLEDGVHKVHVLRRFDKNLVKNVRIFREDQASDNKVLITAVYTDGELMPIEKKPLKIEFIGDSITSGEGLVCGNKMQVWTPAVFGNRPLYALNVARELDADWSVMAKSGWGIHCEGRNNDIRHNMPKYYEFVANCDQSENTDSLGGNDIYDFEKGSAQVTVINLGSNDAFAFGNMAYVDENGVSHQLRFDENMVPNKEDMAMLEQEAYDFIKKICCYNPDTRVIWCYGMLTDRVNPAILGAVKRFNRDYPERCVEAVELPKFGAEYNGSRQHPGAMCHKKYAEILVERIREIL